jgi:hypothetical protein
MTSAHDTATPGPEPKQFDLFIDGGDRLLVHEVVTRLLARDADRSATALARLWREHPSHPDLAPLSLLQDTLRSPPPAPVSAATLAARVQMLEGDVTPAARRCLGRDAGPFVLPLWQALAVTAASVRFSDAHPRAHAGWLWQQCGDWARVRAAVEAEADWTAKPVLRYWLGLARHHLDDPDGAIRLWLPLCWTDPGLFARHAVALPNAMLRDGWETFDRAVPFDEFLEDRSGTEAATWFPAWLLVRHRGLARLFNAGDIPDAGTAARAFGALLDLAPLEGRGLTGELLAGRRALRHLSPGFFRYYMQAVSGRRTGG